MAIKSTNWMGTTVNGTTLGYHIIAPFLWHDLQQDIIDSKPAIIKLVADGSEFSLLSPYYHALQNTYTIFVTRSYSAAQYLDSACKNRTDPIMAARQWYAIVAPLIQYAPTAYWEGINEPGREYTWWVGQMDTERVRLAHQNGFRVACFGASYGTPDIIDYPSPERPTNDDWPSYYAALRAISEVGPSIAVLHVHEYMDAQNGAAPYVLGRINAVYSRHIEPNGWRVWTVISEYGRDNPPWSRCGISAEQYANELCCEEIHNTYHQNVIARAIFTLNDRVWQDWDIRGGVYNNVSAYLKANARIAASGPLRMYTKANLNLRTGPGLGYHVQTVLPKGQGVVVPSYPTAAWTSASIDGWCASRYLISRPDGKFSTTANLNIRTSPGTQYPIQFVMPKGSSLEVISASADWSRVVISGYVSSRYISI